jgi:hypothetical protein
MQKSAINLGYTTQSLVFLEIEEEYGSSKGEITTKNIGFSLSF